MENESSFSPSPSHFCLSSAQIAQTHSHTYTSILIYTLNRCSVQSTGLEVLVLVSITSSGTAGAKARDKPSSRSLCNLRRRRWKCEGLCRGFSHFIFHLVETFCEQENNKVLSEEDLWFPTISKLYFIRDADAAAVTSSISFGLGLKWHQEELRVLAGLSWLHLSPEVGLWFWAGRKSSFLSIIHPNHVLTFIQQEQERREAERSANVGPECSQPEETGRSWTAEAHIYTQSQICGGEELNSTHVSY